MTSPVLYPRAATTIKDRQRFLPLYATFAAAITTTDAQNLFSEPFDSETMANLLRIADSQCPTPDIIEYRRPHNHLVRPQLT